jgi:hypothetical protein
MGMMDNPTIQHVFITFDEVFALVERALAEDDVERAMYWGALALSSNDDADAP